MTKEKDWRCFAEERRFDFGNPDYIQSIYDMGERNRQDHRFEHIDRSRGPAESLYVTRTFFGLYSLLGEIGAEIETRLPITV